MGGIYFERQLVPYVKKIPFRRNKIRNFHAIVIDKVFPFSIIGMFEKEKKCF